MRSIPFAFLDEETTGHINRTAARAQCRPVNGFDQLAKTQQAMRGTIAWPDSMQKLARGFVAMLEKLMEMDGPNSIANLERAIRAQDRPAVQKQP